MKQKMLALLLIVSLCITATIPALAAGGAPRLVDNADLLNDYEEENVSYRLDEVSQRHQLDVVIVTTNTLEGKSIYAYADDFFDYNGYGYGSSRDGILLLVSMENREWWISTCGEAIQIFSDADLDYMGEQMLPHFSAGDYAEAFEMFANLCEGHIIHFASGENDDYESDAFDPLTMLLCALVAGLVVALIVTGIFRAQLKSVRTQYAAANYIQQGSLRITGAGEFFLYRNVSKVAKPQDDTGSGTHRSSSGSVHGGRGGRF